MKYIISSKHYFSVDGTCEGEKGRIFTGVLFGVIESLGSGERAIRRRLRRLKIDGGVAPPGEMGMSSPLLPLLSSCRVLPSRRNCRSSELWLSSGRSKSDIVHQPSRSFREKIRFYYQPCDNTAYQGHSSENDVNSILNHLTRNLRLKNSNQAQVFLRLTPSISSITSFSVGAAEGERKPELSMTQVDTLGSPDVSASLPGFFWALGVLGDAVLVGALLAFSCTSGSYKWQ